MRKKIILGIFFIIFFFSFLFFFYVTTDEKKLIEKKTKIELVEKENIEISEEQIESSNIMEDVSYSAKDIKGNEYFLTKELVPVWKKVLNSASRTGKNTVYQGALKAVSKIVKKGPVTLPEIKRKMGQSW